MVRSQLPVKQLKNIIPRLQGYQTMKAIELSDKDKTYYFKHAGINGSEFNYKKVTPSAEDYAKTIALFEKRLASYGEGAQFNDGTALTIIDDAEEDDATYFLTIEIQHEDAVNSDTLDFLYQCLSAVDNHYRILLAFEYNYIGFDFKCILEKEALYYHIGDQDELSREKFGFE